MKINCNAACTTGAILKHKEAYTVKTTASKNWHNSFLSYRIYRTT